MKISVLVSLFVWFISQASASEFKQVNPSSISLQGGSESSVQWKAPSTSTYKVQVFVPKTEGVPDAMYRIYPKGKSKSSIECVINDIKFPCYEAIVDQTQHQNSWVQLVSNGDLSTQWDFIKGKGYVAAVADNLEETEQLSLDTKVRFENRTVAIGKFYEGGMIFYIDETGKHGLIAAAVDQEPVQWAWPINWSAGIPIFLVTGATAKAVGTGADNTALITNIQGAGAYAASLCSELVLGGYDDWFLPSRDELELMYQTIGNGASEPFTNIGGFKNDFYWSSSEWDTYFASRCNFGSKVANQCGYTNRKDQSHGVRAVRRF